MLTADLVRATCRRGKVMPRFIDPQSTSLQETAERLIAVYDRASTAEPTWRHAELSEALDDLVGGNANPLFFRGLRKLLLDRSQFEPLANCDPIALREVLFRAAAQAPIRRTPDTTWAERRQELLAGVCAQMNLTTESAEEGLYADLEANQRLVQFKAIEPVALLHRYNLALAQAVLIRASRLQVSLAPAKVGVYRQLFRSLKFHQLIHTVRREKDRRFTIEIDGPLSIFSGERRYGVAMAKFLPTLVSTPEWTLTAELQWGKPPVPAQFELTHEAGLVSHVKARGQYVTSEQEWFEERFKKKKNPWRMKRTAKILRTTRGEVVVPDLVFHHEPSGTRAQLEIIGFWRRGSLEKRLAQLDDPKLSHLVLAVSRRLAGDKNAIPPEHPRIVWFKQIINAKQVCERLDALIDSE